MQFNRKPKVVVADSLYGNHLFLAVFLLVENVVALVRLRSNMVFYGPPKPHPKGSEAHPPNMGRSSSSPTPSRPPDRTETFLLGEQTVSLQAWQGLHFKKLPELVGMLLRVEFLAGRWHPALQTSHVAVLDWARNDGAQRIVPDVSLALCHRAFISLCQTTFGLERQSVDRSGQHRSMDVGMCLGLLAIAAHARECRTDARRPGFQPKRLLEH